MRRERKKRGRGARGSLRIIGGEWRSRRLSFTAASGLRPTTDRMRETLFNWLSPRLPGARCADLFAGSGALGLEALSRGAAHCDFVDSSRRCVTEIRQHLETLEGLERAGFFCGTAEGYLLQASQALDIVFVDPPYGAGLTAATCEQIAVSGILAADALVYVEEAAGGASEYPAHWRELRGGVYGGAHCRLFSV